MRKKKDDLEEAIRMMVRIQDRLRKEGIQLGFTLTAIPVPEKQPTEKRS